MAYDEHFDGKKIRPIFRRYLTQHSRLTFAERERALKAARACVQRDAHFLPLVRLISKKEYREVVAGVKQRGRALQKFLHDHYFGDRSYEKAGILTAAQVAKIKERYHVNVDQRPLRPENIQFWYAPDIIRDEEGNFRVIEDNVGFVGGFGDLEAMAAASSALGVPVGATSEPHSFYRRMVQSYDRQARLCGGGKTILLSYPKSEQPNHEDERLARILAAEQVITVTNLRTLKVKDDGLYHLGERVGFVIININVEEIEPRKSSYGISKFWETVGKGKLGVSDTRGLEFVGDKQFCSFVELLVEYYLKETCKVPTLQTLNLEKPSALKKVHQEREKWVIKFGRGQSGKSVWIGPHLTEHAWRHLLTRVKKRPSGFVAQRYCEPSQLLGHPVDLRPLAVVCPRAVHVSPIPWGRAGKGSKDKTNIARGGLLAPVVVV